MRGALSCDGHADQAAPVGGHESDVFGGGQGGGAEQVALVLAAFVVGDNDYTPEFQLVEDLLDGGERALRLSAGHAMSVAAFVGWARRAACRDRLSWCSLSAMESAEHWWRRRWSHLVDGVTFALVNTFQHRHAQSASTGKQIEDYVARWSCVSQSEYFAPSSVDFSFETPGSHPARITFASPHPVGWVENDVCTVDFFPCADRWDRPVMFLLHGLMSASDIGYRGWARKINRLGWHAVFVHLPFHYARRPKGYVSGELAVSGDGVRTLEGVRQAVIEIRSLMQLWSSRGVPAFGVWGMSYGGWVASLCAATDPLVRAALLLEPMVDFSEAVWNSPACVVLKEQARAQGLTFEHCQELDHLISPMMFRPACPKENIVVISAEFDPIIPAAGVERFARHWEAGSYICCPQGHVGYQLMKTAYREWSQRLVPVLG